MRTRKMRLMSFVLALAMMLAIAPVSAFAADKYVSNLHFKGDVPDCGEDYTGGFYTSPNNNWQWDPQGTSFKLNFNGAFDPSQTETNVSENVPCEVRNYGTILGGTFAKTIYNFSATDGGIVSGTFEKIDGRANGHITGDATKVRPWPIIRVYEESVSNGGTNGIEISNAIVWESFVSSSSTNVLSGLFCSMPKKFTGTSKQVLTAKGCTITPVGYDDAVFQGEVYILGENQPNEFIVTATSKKFQNFEYDNDNVTVEPYGEKSIKVTMPASGDVTITAKMDKMPLIVGVGSNGSLRPVDEDGGDYDGNSLDGWHYAEDKNTLTIFEGGVIDLGNNKVDWNIVNNGTIEGGIFEAEDIEKSVLSNNEKTGKITGGTFYVNVANYGEISNGVFYEKVLNYGKVYNGTFAGRYINYPTKENLPDGTVAVVKDGQTIGGVFSHFADFDKQEGDISTRLLTINGGKINDAISGLVYVVGDQKLHVSANDTSAWTGWSVTTDDPDFELTDYQKSHPEFELELDGNDAAKGSIVINALVKDGYYRLNMLDGKATVDGVKATSATVGKTVTLSIDDSEIPEGMSFDHWVISPDVELEGDFKATDRTTSFKMPAQELTIYASLRTDSDDGVDAMTVVAGVAIGAGAAVLTYHIGTELYAKQVLGDGVAIPRTREDVALKAWELAGKPAVAIDGEPLSEAAQAEKWAVESGLMQNVDGSFNGSKKMSKLKALRVLDKAQKLG